MDQDEAGRVPTGELRHSPFAPKALAVLVLGVHRSGTSLATAGLAALGCYLGELPPDTSEENPRGFFENPRFRVFNDRLLRRLGASWDNWGFRATQELAGPAFAAERAEACKLLEKEFVGHAPFALKDPRISSLLPFWEAAFAEIGLKPHRILMLRDPREVAASQARRAAKNPSFYRYLGDPAPMYALWCVTMDTILRNLPDDETLLVGHASLYETPAAVLEEIARFLKLPPAPQRAAAFAADFVDPQLRRSRGEEGAPDLSLAGLAVELHEALAKGGLPRRLTRQEARSIAEGFRGRDLLDALLPAAFRSLSGASAEKGRDEIRLQRLRQAMNLVTDVAVREGSARTLGELRDALPDTGEDRDALRLARAAIAERLGEFDEAARLYAEVAEAVPGFGPALEGRQRALAALSRKDGA